LLRAILFLESKKKNTTAKTYHKKSMFVKANEENKIEMGNL